MSRPSNRVTGRIPATLDDTNASSAAARSRGVSHASTGRRPTRSAQPSSHDRVVPGRIAQSSAGVASSSFAVLRVTDEEDVGAGRLGQQALDRQEQRVVRAGAPRLEPGVDVVGTRRRLEHGQRVLRIAADRRRREVDPLLEMARRRRHDRPRLDRDRRRRVHLGWQEAAPVVDTAGHRDPDRGIAIGPSSASAASRSRIPRARRSAMSAGSSIPSPSADRPSRATCSSSSVTRPARARSVSNTASPSWKPRSKTDRCAPSAGRTSPSTHTCPGCMAR